MTRDELEKSLKFVCEERERLQKENEYLLNQLDLAREESDVLKSEIIKLFHTMTSLETIHIKETEEIEEL